VVFVTLTLALPIQITLSEFDPRQRKRVKYHWYHVRLLETTWKPLLQVHCEAADQLGSQLGDESDLAILSDRVLGDPMLLGSAPGAQQLVALIQRRCLELLKRSEPLGCRLLAEKHKSLKRRFRRYWDTWTVLSEDSAVRQNH
jgi:hypothetical protein